MTQRTLVTAILIGVAMFSSFLLVADWSGVASRQQPVQQQRLIYFRCQCLSLGNDRRVPGFKANDQCLSLAHAGKTGRNQSRRKNKFSVFQFRWLACRSGGALCQRARLALVWWC